MQPSGDDGPFPLDERKFVRLADVIAHQDYVEQLRAAGMDSLEGLFSVRGAMELSKPNLGGWRYRARLSMNGNREWGTLYLKRFTSPPRRARGDRRSQGYRASSVAGLEAGWLLRLRAAGIPCPQLVAFGEEVKNGKEIRSALVTAAVPGQSLESWCVRWMAGERRDGSWLVPLALLVRKFHGFGCVHRDLYLSHVFFDPTQPGPRVTLIDLQRVCRPGHLFGRWVVKDLAALQFSAPSPLISRADRMRWFKHYLSMAKLTPRAKRMAYRVLGKAARLRYRRQVNAGVASSGASM